MRDWSEEEQRACGVGPREVACFHFEERTRAWLFKGLNAHLETVGKKQLEASLETERAGQRALSNLFPGVYAGSACFVGVIPTLPACAVGTIRLCAGGTSCTPCGDRETTLMAGSETCTCDVGYYRDMGVCSRCAQGLYKEWVGEGPCDPIPAMATYIGSLNGTCYTYAPSGDWSYQVCFGNLLRQYSVNDDNSLGSFTSDSSEDVIVDATNASYAYQAFTGGTPCDDLPRSGTVRIKCETEGGPSGLASMSEETTCVYILEFYTSLICDHPSFQSQL